MLFCISSTFKDKIWTVLFYNTGPLSSDVQLLRMHTLEQSAMQVLQHFWIICNAEFELTISTILLTSLPILATLLNACVSVCLFLCLHHLRYTS